MLRNQKRVVPLHHRKRNGAQQNTKTMNLTFKQIEAMVNDLPRLIKPVSVTFDQIGEGDGLKISRPNCHYSDDVKAVKRAIWKSNLMLRQKLTLNEELTKRYAI